MTVEQGNNNKPPVVIIGAGPAGLMAALVLTDAGVPVEIYERNLKPTTEWRAAAVHSRVIEMVARYGLSEKLINSSNPFDEFRFIRNGRNLPGISLDLIRSEFSFVLGCGQDITESVLHEKLAQLNVHVKWGWEYMSYEVVNNNNEHMIKIELKKVDSDETIVREAIYMIGCDGGHSKIRKTIGAKFDGKFVDYRIAVCDVEVDSDWLPVSCFVSNPDGMLGIIRAHLGNKYRMFMTWSSDDPELTSDSLMAVIKRRIYPYELQDPRVLSFSSFAINERRASQFMSNDGRVFLCGDAAHVHSPAGGQGMNTGLQDAENLAWKIGMVYNGFAKPELLKSYDTERTIVADGVLELSGSILSILISPTKILMMSKIMPLMRYMPLFISRPQMEKITQLRIKYPTGEHCSSFGDSQGWIKATSSWFSFGWFSGSVCTPGTRSIDCQLIDAATQSKTRIRNFYATHNQSFKGVIFIDYRKTESPKNNTNSNISDANTRQLSSNTIEELKKLIEAFRAYQSAVKPAFVIHGISNANTETAAISEFVNKLVEQLNSEFIGVPVFIDVNQGSKYDNMTMADLYTCSHLKQHAVYLVRPDTYVSARMLLPEAATEIRKHLNTICL